MEINFYHLWEWKRGDVNFTLFQVDFFRNKIFTCLAITFFNFAVDIEWGGK